MGMKSDEMEGDGMGWDEIRWSEVVKIVIVVIVETDSVGNGDEGCDGGEAWRGC